MSCFFKDFVKYTKQRETIIQQKTDRGYFDHSFKSAVMYQWNFLLR
jgi:hypothetical protein